MKPAARASSASRSAGGARASRSSDGSLARDPRGNESRADQRLSFPGRLAKPSPSPATAFEIQPTPRTASDRHSEIGRATKRTTRANLPNTPCSCHQRQGRTSLPSIGRAREAARIDGRSGVAFEGADGYTPMTWRCPARPFVGRNAKATPRRRANQSRVLNFILDRKQQYIWVRLGHSEDHRESYGNPSSYSARRLLWLGHPRR